MAVLIFLGGVILGVLCTLKYKSRERIHGIIHIDHETEQCIFSLTSDELNNRDKKIVVFMVNHDATISREEQTL